MEISSRWIIILLFSLLLIVFSMSALAHGLNVGDVSKEFICNCGCGKLLSDCDMECGKTLRKVISTKIGEDWTKKQIIEYMKVTYGETLLAAPPKKGFNLTAWTTPFLAILVAGCLIASILIRWTKERSDHRKGPQHTGDKAISNKRYLERYEKEMKELEI